METNFNKKLGTRIREIRIARHIKQGELADMLNMERSNLTMIESGKQRPNDENIEKIAEILGVEIKDLFDFEHTLLSKDELIHLINNQLIVLDTNKLQYIYKSVQNIQEL